MGERSEALMRIFVAIISGIILGLWKVIIQVVVVIHWIYVIFVGKRNKGLADFCNMWVTYAYNFIRYITFSTNKRPFPFGEFGKDIEKVDMK